MTINIEIISKITFLVLAFIWYLFAPIFSLYLNKKYDYSSKKLVTFFFTILMASPIIIFLITFLLMLNSGDTSGWGALIILTGLLLLDGLILPPIIFVITVKNYLKYKFTFKQRLNSKERIILWGFLVTIFFGGLLVFWFVFLNNGSAGITSITI